MKTSKLVLVLLAVMLSMALVVGCGGEDPVEGPLGDGWQVGYIVLEEGTNTTKAINGLHFHVNTGTVELQKVFVNTTKSLTGSKTALDFTQTAGKATDGSTKKYFGEVDGYWYHLDGSVENFEAQVLEGGTANGRLVISSANDTWKYHGGFASPASFDNNANYYGFVFKGDDLGDTRIVVFEAETEKATIRFSELVK